MGEHDETVRVATSAGRASTGRVGRWVLACGLAAGLAAGTVGCAPGDATAAAGTQTAAPSTSRIAPSPDPATTAPAPGVPGGPDAASALAAHRRGAPRPPRPLTTARGPRVSAPVDAGAGNPWGDTYTNVDGAQVQRPVAAPSAPAGARALCGDGTWSFSRHPQGTCSRHGGVARFL